MKRILSKHLSKLSLLPIVILLIIMVFFLINSLQHYSDTKHTFDNATVVTLTSNLLHELQKERGMTAGFIGSKGKQFINEIKIQRSLVDENNALLQIYMREHSFNKSITHAVTEFEEHLSGLEAIRSQVDNLSMDLRSSLSYYTNGNEFLLHFNSVLAHYSSDLENMQNLTTLYNLAYTKEESGIERAVLSNVFAQGKFTDAAYDRFSELLADQHIYFKVAEDLTADNFRAELTSFKNSAENKTVEEFRKYALINHSKSLSRNAKDWFDAATQRINLLKKTEDILLAHVIKRAEDSITVNTFWMITYIVFSVITMVFAYFIYRVLQDRQTQASLIKRVMSRVQKDGDISNSIEVIGDDDLGRIAELLNYTFEQLRTDFTGFQNSSSKIAEESKSTAATTLQSQENLSQQQVSVASTVSLVESVSVGITQTTEDIKKSAHYAEESKMSAVKGEGVVEEAVDGIKQTAEDIAKVNDEVDRLNKNVADIVGMVDVIHSVADQTNLLALNAAIEAARAGEQGRGFAVVADEVRSLAKRTQDSTQEISAIIEQLKESASSASGLIKSSNEQVTTSVKLAENVHLVLHDIVTNMTELNDINQSISSSAEVQLQSILDITNTVRSIDDHAAENSTGAELIAKSAIALSSVADNMLEEIQKYKVE